MEGGHKDKSFTYYFFSACSFVSSCCYTSPTPPSSITSPILCSPITPDPPTRWTGEEAFLAYFRELVSHPFTSPLLSSPLSSPLPSPLHLSEVIKTKLILEIQTKSDWERWKIYWRDAAETAPENKKRKRRQERKKERKKEKR